MILAYHLTISCYGFWLPNDPRGSWSDFVRRYELLEYGNATTTDVRHSIAHTSHDRRQREEAKKALMYPPVRFTSDQAVCVVRGVMFRIERSEIPVYACAVMPDHVHLVLGRFRYSVEQMANLLKGAATQQLTREGLHPHLAYRSADGSMPSPWVSRFWAVYLDSPEDVRRAIQYDENNPIKAGMRRQRYTFVKPYTD